MRNDHPSPARSPSIRLAWLVAALWLACAGALHAQPARGVLDVEPVTVSGSSMLQRRAEWKVPPDAYLRERKAMLAELRINRERWARRRPAAYAFRLHAGCMYMPFCPAPGWKVAVPAGSPRGVSGEGAPWSMEKVFALLEEGLRSDNVRMTRVHFHPRLGYPLRWDWEGPPGFSHGRGVRRVRDFRALSPPRMKQTAVSGR